MNEKSITIACLRKGIVFIGVIAFAVIIGWLNVSVLDTVLYKMSDALYAIIQIVLFLAELKVFSVFYFNASLCSVNVTFTMEDSGVIVQEKNLDTVIGKVNEINLWKSSVFFLIPIATVEIRYNKKKVQYSEIVKKSSIVQDTNLYSVVRMLLYQNSKLEAAKDNDGTRIEFKMVKDA
ncbi:MAG: hypothetical protein LBM02_09260 [Lachnospiraceae bacterium]|jgi:hypothetical protein|nr:hypothetical protein [Lachnospiraceae bacterium]